MGKIQTAKNGNRKRLIPVLPHRLMKKFKVTFFKITGSTCKGRNIYFILILYTLYLEKAGFAL